MISYSEDKIYRLNESLFLVGNQLFMLKNPYSSTYNCKMCHLNSHECGVRHKDNSNLVHSLCHIMYYKNKIIDNKVYNHESSYVRIIKLSLFICSYLKIKLKNIINYGI